MALWGNTDTFADVPKYLQPTVTFDGTTAVAVDGTFTVVDHPFEDGDEVKYTSSAAASGLVSGTDYFVVNRTATTFQLAATSGGVAIATATVNGAADDSLQQVAEPPAYFIDTEEAGVSTNKDVGLKTSGWNTLRTWTTNGGAVTRYAAEPIVAMGTPVNVSGDAEDVVTPDPTFAFDTTPGVAPSVAEGDTVTLTVTTTSNNDDTSVAYIWEYDPAGGTAFIDVPDALAGYSETAGGVGAFSSTLSFTAEAALNLATFRVTAQGTFPGGNSITTAPSPTITLTVTA